MIRKSYKKESIVNLIDKLAPYNNEFRAEEDPIRKIEAMWEIGSLIDEYLKKSRIKLHTLLFEIYNPHSTIKMSYITRDIGSYSFRVFKFFKNKEEIGKQLKGLRQYNLFREAIPLLFNSQYDLRNKEKSKVLRLITSKEDQKSITEKLRVMKQAILPIKNPRTQKANQYIEEKKYLKDLENKVNFFYEKFSALPRQKILSKYFWDKEEREMLVNTLMILASDSFLNKLSNIDPHEINEQHYKLFLTAISKNEDRARFRKWVMSSINLLRLAEAIYSLNDANHFQFFRKKILSENII